MATHDYVIDNGSGASVRSDLNSALAAIASNNSNATAPTTTYAYMWWCDTTTGLLKQRNSTNTAWVSKGLIADAFLTSSDIGATVQAYDADTANLDVVQSWTAVQTFSKAARGTPVALTSTSNSIAVDASAGNYFTHTFTENTTLANPSNLVAGQEGVIVFTQHASSPKTLAFGSYWKFPGGTVPSVTATNSAVDALAYYVESGTRITAKLLLDVK